MSNETGLELGSQPRLTTPSPILVRTGSGVTTSDADQILRSFGLKPMSTPEEERAYETLRQLLRTWHMQASATPIAHADPAGEFPGAAVARPPSIVLDANVLRDDILYACRTASRTTLITAANQQALRLYSAEHVIDEVEQYAEKWSVEKGLEHSTFMGIWNASYLPLIRAVTNPPVDLLLPDEVTRIEKLKDPVSGDPDDVPSAVLALLLGAIYLTKDSKAARAAYGPERDPEELTRWLDILRAGGDAGQLGVAFEMSLLVVGTPIMGIASAYGALTKSLPMLVRIFIPIGLLGLAAWEVSKLDDDTRDVVMELGSAIASFAGAMMGERAGALRLIENAAVAVPPPDTEVANLSKRTLVARRLIRELARSRAGCLTVASLAAQIRADGLLVSESTVRSVLRTYACFDEVYRGWWQVGQDVSRTAGIPYELDRDQAVRTLDGPRCG
ncbi:MAG: PIN domain-containing protein [Candidatus Dormibacteria bacterium]